MNDSIPPRNLDPPDAQTSSEHVRAWPPILISPRVAAACMACSLGKLRNLERKCSIPVVHLGTGRRGKRYFFVDLIFAVLLLKADEVSKREPGRPRHNDKGRNQSSYHDSDAWPSSSFIALSDFYLRYPFFRDPKGGNSHQ